MASVSGATLTDIYNRLQNAPQYHPLEADTFSDWATEAGDIVTLKRGDAEYASPIHSTRMVWKGAPEMTLNSVGRKEREAVSRISKKKYGRGSGGLRNEQYIYHEFTSEDGYLHSSIYMSESLLRTEFGNSLSDVGSSITQTADEIRSEVHAANSTIYSSISQTASQIRSEVANTASGLSSQITQTASQIRSEVANTESNLRSLIVQTASGIYQEVGTKAQIHHMYNDPTTQTNVKEGDLWVKDANVRTNAKAAGHTYGDLANIRYADFYGSEIYIYKDGEWQLVGGDQLAEISRTRIDQTDDYIRLIAENFDGDFAEFQVEANRIRSRVEDVEAGLASTIEQTASMIRSAVFTANSAMYSEIMQTQSMIQSTVANTESNLQTQITTTAGRLETQLSTKSRIFVQWTKPAVDSETMEGDLWIKSNWMRTYGEMSVNSYNLLSQYKNCDFYGSQHYIFTNGDWRLMTDEQLANITYNMQVDTTEKFQRTIGDMQTNYAQLVIEKDQIKSTVRDVRNDLGSSITQTASQIRLEVHAANSTIYSSIAQTASQIRSEVANSVSALQSSITQQADKIALVVEGTGSNAKIKPAQIVAAINNGASSIIISADHVDLDGYVTASSLTTDWLKTKVSAISNVYVKSLTVASGGSVKFEGGDGTTITGSQAADIIRNLRIQLSGNTYTLQKITCGDATWTDIGTFSRATSLSGAWSGQTYTVTASPQGNKISILPVAYPVSSQGAAYTDVYVATTNGSSWTTHGDGTRLTMERTNARIDLKDSNGSVYAQYTFPLQSKTVTANGTVTPDDGYGGLSSVTVNINAHTTRYTLSCTKAEATYPGSNIKNFTFTLQGVYSFSSGLNYDFYR